MLKFKEQGAHPGWAVQFSDGSWLGGAHGWFRSDEACYADVYDSEEEALSNLKYVKNDLKYKEDFSLDAKAVPAWEQCCEYLRRQVIALEKANKISPGYISEIVDSMEQIVADLKGCQ